MIGYILDKFRTKPRQTFFITDTVGDIKIARKSGLRTIAVTWGFHGKIVLKKAKPDYIVSTFNELSKILGSADNKKLSM